MGNPDSPIPSWVNKWLLATSLVCIWDGSFCVLRPHSLPDGCLGKVFYGYHIYIAADKNYANPRDVFIFTQGFGNLVEAVCGLLVVFNIIKNIRANKILAIVVSIMTFWKTVLFGVYSLEIPLGGKVVENWFYELLVFGPTLLWIILPAYSAYTLIQDFLCDVPRSESPPIPSDQSTAGSDAGSDLDNFEFEEGDNKDVTVNGRPRYNLRNRQT